MRFKFLFAGILAILVISCTKNNEIQPEIEDSDISYASAFKEFSKILSEAVFQMKPSGVSSRRKRLNSLTTTMMFFIRK